MNNKQSPTKPIIFGLTLTSLLFGGLGIFKPLITPKIASAISLNQFPFQLSLKFRLPSKGTPGRRRGAGSRDGYCISDEKLVALMPQTNFGLTVAERPTFWFYVPYQSDQLEAEFLLEDNEGNKIDSQIVALNNTPGIVKVTLPENLPPLEVEQLYVWRLSVICDPDNRLDDDYVWGGFELVSMSFEIKNQLKDKTKRERLKIYAANGLWFDVVTTLAELRESNVEEQDLDEDWVELLQQVGLEEISDKLLVDCCTSEQ
ncbi:MAG: DUF928 domain-containing protein [Symploca sp. SIO1B1]|nr:DUF928 domain-containing protein [Symploca sp. SIO1B1]